MPKGSWRRSCADQKAEAKARREPQTLDQTKTIPMTSWPRPAHSWMSRGKGQRAGNADQNLRGAQSGDRGTDLAGGSTAVPRGLRWRSSRNNRKMSKASWRSCRWMARRQRRRSMVAERVSAGGARHLYGAGESGRCLCEAEHRTGTAQITKSTVKLRDGATQRGRGGQSAQAAGLGSMITLDMVSGVFAGTELLDACRLYQEDGVKYLVSVEG